MTQSDMNEITNLFFIIQALVFLERMKSDVISTARVSGMFGAMQNWRSELEMYLESKIEE